MAPSPPPPTLSPCQQNLTATVTFENRYSSTTIDVIWDGAKLVTLTPGQRSTPTTVAAIVAHRLSFQVTNTSLAACNAGSPTLAVCATTNYFCPGS